MKKSESKNREKEVRLILPFVIIILLIFLIAVSLSWQNITRFFARLGFGLPMEIMEITQEYTYTIPSSQLHAGWVVGYYSFANDTAGNPNTTITQTFKVIYPENTTDIHIEDENHQPAATIQQGHQFYVVFNLTNQRTSDVTRRRIVQVTDPDGLVVQPIDSSRTTISSGQEEEIDVGYVAEKTGTYTAQVLVWTGWLSPPESGFPIAYMETTTFNSV